MMNTKPFESTWLERKAIHTDRIGNTIEYSELPLENRKTVSKEILLVSVIVIPLCLILLFFLIYPYSYGYYSHFYAFFLILWHFMNEKSTYEVIITEGRAKRARLSTVHGVIETPVFMNVGTVAAIKGAVSTADLENIKC